LSDEGLLDRCHAALDIALHDDDPVAALHAIAFLRDVLLSAVPQHIANGRKAGIRASVLGAAQDNVAGRDWTPPDVRPGT
jgi:hypothetical protein